MSINQLASGAEREEYLRKRNMEILEMTNILRDNTMIDQKLEHQHKIVDGIVNDISAAIKLQKFGVEKWISSAEGLITRAIADTLILSRSLQDTYKALEELALLAKFREAIVNDLTIENILDPHSPDGPQTVWFDLDHIHTVLKERVRTLKWPDPREELLRNLKKNRN